MGAGIEGRGEARRGDAREESETRGGRLAVFLVW